MGENLLNWILKLLEINQGIYIILVLYHETFRVKMGNGGNHPRKYHICMKRHIVDADILLQRSDLFLLFCNLPWLGHAFWFPVRGCTRSCDTNGAWRCQYVMLYTQQWVTWWRTATRCICCEPSTDLIILCVNLFESSQHYYYPHCIGEERRPRQFI